MPSMHYPLVTYKAFMEMQHDNVIDSHDAQRMYDEYKTIHQEKQSKIFFDQHKNESWFREKYDPELSYKWKMEIIQ